MDWTEEIIKNPGMVSIKFARYKFAANLLRRNDSVLDIGCGDGTSSNFFSSYARKVTGIDSDTSMVSYAQRTWDKTNLSFHCMDALEIGSLGSQYDVLIMLDFIEHLTANDGKQLLVRCKDNLLPDGMLIVGTPNKNFCHLRSERSRKVHIHEYSPEEFRSLLDGYFQRVLYFCMNEEMTYTGNMETAWFLWGVCLNGGT